MMPEPLDPAAIMAAHHDDHGRCYRCFGSAAWPCLPYRLAGDVMFARGERDAEEDRADRLTEALTTARREGAEQALNAYADAVEKHGDPGVLLDWPSVVADVCEWAESNADKIAKGDDE